jgi:hypothetical protein
MPRYSGREQGGHTGWSHLEATGHLCFPPQIYPKGAGPGSQWACPNPSCNRVWLAYGMLVSGDYPVALSRNDVGISPARWELLTGLAASVDEIRMYNFDPEVVVTVK